MKTFLKRFTTLPVMILGLAAVSLLAGFVSVSALNQPNVAQASQCEVTTCIDIREDGFSQAELAVKAGSTVEFRSADGGSHNLALGRGTDHAAHSEPAAKTDHEDASHGDDHHSEDAAHDHGDATPHDHVAGTESGEFGANEAWRVQFKEPGTYLIHDHLNPDFTILVVVYNPAS